MKVRYWQETTETEFYELWPEFDRNKIEMVVLRVIPDEEMEDFLYGEEEEEEGE